MTQEEKELLLKDLCARLPYRVYISPVDCGKAILIGIKDGNSLLLDTIHKKEYDKPWDIEYIKPYLRPMSSMTDEERSEWADLFNLELDKLNEISDEDKAEELAPYYFGKCHQVSIDWLNAHHFDYRGLIPKGLALEAPEGMY